MKMRNCPVCDGQKINPYANNNRLCRNCNGTGKVEAKPIKNQLDYDLGSIKYQENYGFVIDCMNDSVYFDVEQGVKIANFILENTSHNVNVLNMKTIKTATEMVYEMFGYKSIRTYERNELIAAMHAYHAQFEKELPEETVIDQANNYAKKHFSIIDEKYDIAYQAYLEGFYDSLPQPPIK